MTTGSESKSTKKSAFSGLVVVASFLQEAEAKYGLTSEALKRLKESPSGMEEFVKLAKSAEEEHLARIRRINQEMDCAVDSDGHHYHLVLISRSEILEWCSLGVSDPLISEIATKLESRGYEATCEKARALVPRLLATLSGLGDWICLDSIPTVYQWKITSERVKWGSSYGEVKGMRLSMFPELQGVVCMSKYPDCEFRPLPKE